MRAREQLRVARQRHRTRIGAADTQRFELVRHVARALPTATARVRQTFYQCRVVGVYAQPDDVYGFAGVGD